MIAQDFLTTREVADMHNISPTTVRSYIFRGELSAPKKTEGGRYKWKRRDVNRLSKLIAANRSISG